MVWLPLFSKRHNYSSHNFHKTVFDNEAGATTEGCDSYNELRQKSPHTNDSGRGTPWGLADSQTGAMEICDLGMAVAL